MISDRREQWQNLSGPLRRKYRKRPKACSTPSEGCSRPWAGSFEANHTVVGAAAFYALRRSVAPFSTVIR
jgi:hypothetical protein